MQSNAAASPTHTRSTITKHRCAFKHCRCCCPTQQQQQQQQVECYGGIEASLLGLDLVLNCEYPGDWGQLHNAAMASAPGHPFWLAVLQEALQRAPAAPTPAATAAAAAAVAEAAAAAAPGGGSSRVAGSSTSWVQRRVQRLWEATPFANRINAVLRSTGPMLLTDVYQVCVGGGKALGCARCGRCVSCALSCVLAFSCPADTNCCC
jgi:hypothetical protein